MMDNYDCKFLRRIDGFSQLKIGWDGTDAAPPSEASQAEARRFLRMARVAGILPNTVDPVVDGGIAFSFQAKKSKKEIYLEFANEGLTSCALMTGRSGGVKDLPTENLIQLAADIKKHVG